MECLTDIKIQEYVEGSLNSVENAMVRDHLIVCSKCRIQHEEYELLEKQLFQPVEITPPAVIERRVMSHLFPKIPTYSSIVTLIAASFVMLVTSIYIYFDFANNSIVQAIRLTSNNTSNWIASIVTFMSNIFSGVYTGFKVLNRFLDIVFNINIGAEIIGLSVFLILSGVVYSILKLTLKRIKT